MSYRSPRLHHVQDLQGEECPAEAIKEGDPKYVIDPDKCTDCGTCAEVCPVEACVSV
jgi:ferredoxin